LVDRLKSITDREPPFARERTCLAAALLATGAPAAAEEAVAEILADREGTFPDCDQVQAWLLAALAADSLRLENRAMEATRHAVLLASASGVWLPFAVLDGGALQRQLARLVAVEPALAAQVDELRSHVGSTADRPRPVSLDVPLTDRELLVLRYVPTMMTNAEIAAELFVSVNTVKAHLKNIYRKLGVETRREAAHQARRLGLLDAGDGTERATD
jgi:LuxR family maltose regulon positive regulatory protein